MEQNRVEPVLSQFEGFADTFIAERPHVTEGQAVIDGITRRVWLIDGGGPINIKDQLALGNEVFVTTAPYKVVSGPTTAEREAEPYEYHRYVTYTITYTATRYPLFSAGNGGGNIILQDRTLATDARGDFCTDTEDDMALSGDTLQVGRGIPVRHGNHTIFEGSVNQILLVGDKISDSATSDLPEIDSDAGIVGLLNQHPDISRSDIVAHAFYGARHSSLWSPKHFGCDIISTSHWG